MTRTFLLRDGVKTAVVTAAAATGVAAADSFGVQPRPTGGDRTLVLAAAGTGAVPTTVTADLESSADQGVTWQKYATALALVAAGVGATTKVLNVVAGLLYRVNITALTLGGASAVGITVVAN